MGELTESRLDEIVQAGCKSCLSSRLHFRAYLDARLPLLGGEPVGKLKWCYDGEKFVDGIFEVSCADCKQPIFASAMCPRCNAPDGLARSLESENSFPRLQSCPSCDGEELRFTAMVPAAVAYEGKRAAAPSTHTDCYDPGFHGYRVDCPDCGPVAEQTVRCPLCDALGPLRVRPG